MSIFGIDFSYGSGLTTAEMKVAGVRFVCRYLSGGGSKDINAAELANYQSAGIPVVLVWETGGFEPSKAQGAADATAAQSELNSLGLPNSPVYFALDIPPTSAIDIRANEYMRGVASVLGYNRTGMYGAYEAIAHYFDHTIGKFGWQTYAWSSGQWDTRAQLQQYQNGMMIGPASVDYDRALAADYGQNPRPAPVATNPVANLRVTRRGFTSVSLAWAGQRNATSYTVETYWRGTRIRDPQVSTVTDVRIGGLKPFHTYTFRVRAHPGGSAGADAVAKATTR